MRKMGLSMIALSGQTDGLWWDTGERQGCFGDWVRDVSVRLGGDDRMRQPTPNPMAVCVNAFEGNAKWAIRRLMEAGSRHSSGRDMAIAKSVSN